MYSSSTRTLAPLRYGCLTTLNDHRAEMRALRTDVAHLNYLLSDLERMHAASKPEGWLAEEEEEARELAVSFEVGLSFSPAFYPCCARAISSNPHDTRDRSSGRSI